jgi:hypothetical protein
VATVQNSTLHVNVFLNQLRAISEGVVQAWKANMDGLGFDVDVLRIDIIESVSRRGVEAQINLKLMRRP